MADAIWLSFMFVMAVVILVGLLVWDGRNDRD